MKKKNIEDILFQEGFGTRKECRKLFFNGRVSVNGIAVEDPETPWVDGFSLAVDSEAIEPSEHLYLAYHKPVDQECSHSPSHHASVFSAFPERYLLRGLQCAGRLDVDTSGLLLLSDDGDFLHHVISPRRGLTKTYLVTLAHPLPAERRQALLQGVHLRGEKEIAKAISLEPQGEQWKIVVGEGRYHLVKRLFGASANRVQALHRIAVADLEIGDLAPGKWIRLTAGQLQKLGWPIQ